MGAEFTGVFALDVILIRIVLKDHQVGHGTDKADLADLLFKTQEKHNAVITRHVYFAAEVAAQVALLVTAQPARIALAMGCNAVIQAIQNGPLLFLY